MSVFEGTRLLRGKPGLKVTLTIIRGNAADPHEISLVRGKRWPTAGDEPPDRDDGLCPHRLVPQRRVVEVLRKQAADLSKSGAKALIVDVRRTAEGPLENGIQAARAFVKNGTLAIKSSRAKTEAREPVAAKAGDATIELPTTVLITTGTSGPAELFTAALNDNKRAELIGERTLGRAGLQKLVKLPEGRGLWLTYARYLTPNGTAIQGKGLEPTVTVDEPDVEFGAAPPDKDLILDAALERVKTKAAA